MKQNVRLTIDMPIEQHSYLKMLAAKKGVSMRKYIMDSLFEKEAPSKDRNENFKMILNTVIQEHDETLRRLADR